MRERTKEKGFHNYLMIMDAFKAHFTGNVSLAKLIGHTDVVNVPKACTFKVQPLDVCINKPFKPILKDCWEGQVVKVVKAAGDEASNNPSFKLGFPTKQDIVNWVHRRCVFMQESKAMSLLFFEVCDITTTIPGLVCNEDFLKRIMTNVAVGSVPSDDDMFKDFFEKHFLTKHYLFNYCIKCLLSLSSFLLGFFKSVTYKIKSCDFFFLTFSVSNLVHINQSWL